MSDETNSSRVEDGLRNIMGESHDLEKPRSRVEEILTNILNGSSIFGKAQSRVEDLLIELAGIIESGGGSSLTDLDQIAFGNNPIVPEEGRILSDNLEDIADAINEMLSRPTITISAREDTITDNGTYSPQSGEAWDEVTVEVDAQPSLQSLSVAWNDIYYPEEGYDGFDEVTVDVRPSLQSLTATDNGTTYMPDEGYDGFDEVTVNVDTGYTSGMSISGTLDSPWGNATFSIVRLMLHNLWESIDVRAVMNIDATSLGLGSGVLILIPQTVNGSSAIIGTGGLVDQSSSNAVTITWTSNGLISAYVEQNGVISDLLPYASSIDTVVYGPTK